MTISTVLSQHTLCRFFIKGREAVNGSEAGVDEGGEEWSPWEGSMPVGASIVNIY